MLFFFVLDEKYVKERKFMLKAEPENKRTPLTVRFKKPFVFEDKKYTSVDLNGLEDLTGTDMKEVEKMLREMGVSSFQADFSVEGALLYAARAAKLPVEFFEVLPLKEARKVKVKVQNFFLE